VRTEAQLRRAVLGALHTITGTMEPWREVGVSMRRYLGPWVGMTATERWETLPALELELLADALEERAAIMVIEPDALEAREVVICGGRDYQPTQADGRWCSWWLAWLAARTVVHGGARGVDRWAGTLAARLGLRVVVVKPDYDAYPGRVAPLERNTVMADREPLAVLALPGGSGTDDMVTKATARGVPVWLRSDPSTAIGGRAA